MNTEQLEKYLAGDASQPEKESVQQWMETDEKHRTEFAALRTLYDISLAHLSEDEPVRQAARPFAEWLKVAAAILITFVCSHYFFNPASAMDEAALQTLYIPAGQRAELSLADGTKVWLNSLTTFTFPDHFTDTSREVFLDGEAYFVVAHDGAKLFSIHTPVYDVQVLGTEFNVSAYGKEQGTFETSLINGAVEVLTLTLFFGTPCRLLHINIL
ncbi:MAG: FecR family protein [Tannerella sp.]|jgi:ferric-dicitrate binding protein FerR (iron transport regulator)|nr:FecR family protein [Tannerella sp.]